MGRINFRKYYELNNRLSVIDTCKYHNIFKLFPKLLHRFHLVDFNAGLYAFVGISQRQHIGGTWKIIPNIQMA